VPRNPAPCAREAPVPWGNPQSPCFGQPEVMGIVSCEDYPAQQPSETLPSCSRVWKKRNGKEAASPAARVQGRRAERAEEDKDKRRGQTERRRLGTPVSGNCC
jgi:hypothetical protein